MRTIQFFKGTLAVFFLILLCGTLSACGQKGELVLPPSDAERMPVTPQVLPEPETDKPESERAPLGILPGSDPTLP